MLLDNIMPLLTEGFKTSCT